MLENSTQGSVGPPMSRDTLHMTQHESVDINEECGEDQDKCRWRHLDHERPQGPQLRGAQGLPCRALYGPCSCIPFQWRGPRSIPCNGPSTAASATAYSGLQRNYPDFVPARQVPHFILDTLPSLDPDTATASRLPPALPPALACPFQLPPRHRNTTRSAIASSHHQFLSRSTTTPLSTTVAPTKPLVGTPCVSSPTRATSQQQCEAAPNPPPHTTTTSTTTTTSLPRPSRLHDSSRAR